jgi:hypothetical protein
VGARLNAVFAAAQRSSKGMGRVSIVVKNEIGVSVTVEPARNLVALLLECGADGRFGTATVIPC